MNALSTMSGEAFADTATYTGKRPDAGYLRSLLGSDYFIALAAIDTDGA